MGRPSIDLEPFKREIISLYQQNTSCPAISEILYDKYDFDVNARTILTRLRAWGMEKRRNNTARSDTVLHARIKILFFQVGLEEKDLLHVLHKDGWDIKARTLKHIRLALGLYRRTNSIEVVQEQADAVIEEIEKTIKSGQVEGYGTEFLQRHIRRQGIIISRDRLFSIYRNMAPASVRRRLHDLQRHRGAYVVPGPNYMWSIDGYMKLAPYGIEIYAAIDAYSRYIIWIYVGITSRTAVSVLRQFLDVIQETKKTPRFIRSDRGTETILLAEAHHKLQQSVNPDTSIQECYIYGTSTANQRIEAWWLQLTKGILWRWKDYFLSLQQEGLYSGDDIAAQIALFAIYMPIIRVQIVSFVRTWNIHSIRKQKLRPHLVHGKPFMNYNFPAEGVQDYGIEYNPDLLQTLQNEIAQWDPDEYLPRETYNWTYEQLSELGFNLKNPLDSPDGDQFSPYRTVFIELRKRIQTHIEEGHQPTLSLSTRPIGGFNWQPAPEIEEVEIGFDQFRRSDIPA